MTLEVILVLLLLRGLWLARAADYEIDRLLEMNRRLASQITETHNGRQP
jgi:hypothetical protein